MEQEGAELGGTRQPPTSEGPSIPLQSVIQLYVLITAVRPQATLRMTPPATDSEPNRGVQGECTVPPTPHPRPTHTHTHTHTHTPPSASRSIRSRTWKANRGFTYYAASREVQQEPTASHLPKQPAPLEQPVRPPPRALVVKASVSGE